MKKKIFLRKPEWLRRNISPDGEYAKLKRLMQEQGLHTVCEEAHCPNRFECYARGTATFMILGDRCTRNCRFCAVKTGPVSLPDPLEPERIADIVKLMNLSYVVITSVTRDDVEDGGADMFAATIEALQKINKEIKVEVLIPDFKGNRESLARVLEFGPDVLNHNIETVESLYGSVCPQASYERSLNVLRQSAGLSPSVHVKSGLMLGLGESDRERSRTLKDLRDAGCAMLTLGQYLQPGLDHYPVSRYLHPDEFEDVKIEALEMGFSQVASGPLVRSSYQASGMYRAMCQGN